MKSITIYFMLNKKNIYALLFIYVTHLGCSSSYRDQMDKQGTSGASTPKKEGMHSKFKGSGNVELDKMVSRFIDKGNFKKGFNVTHGEIGSVFEKLGRQTFSLDKDYKDFLEYYGCIYGSGFCVCGPISVDESADKIEYILLKQRGFETRCRVNKMEEEQAKLCWLIAEDEDNQYYFDFSNKKNGYIYSMGLDGKSRFFSKNFLDFLGKFFSIYESKI